MSETEKQVKPVAWRYRPHDEEGATTEMPWATTTDHELARMMREHGGFEVDDLVPGSCSQTARKQREMLLSYIMERGHSGGCESEFGPAPCNCGYTDIIRAAATNIPAPTDADVRRIAEVVAISLIDGGWIGQINDVGVDRLERRIESAIREAMGMRGDTK